MCGLAEGFRRTEAVIVKMRYLRLEHGWDKYISLERSRRGFSNAFWVVENRHNGATLRYFRILPTTYYLATTIYFMMQYYKVIKICTEFKA